MKKKPTRLQRRQAQARKAGKEAPPTAVSPSYKSQPEIVSGADAPGNVTAEIPVEKAGYPGSLVRFVVVPQFESRNSGPQSRDEDLRRLHDKTERPFAVSARLATSPMMTRTLILEIEDGSGDTFVALPEGAINSKVTSQFGTFHMRKNSSGRISTIKYDLSAKSHREARKAFLVAVSPLLDRISFSSNSPIVIDQISVVDPKYQITETELIAPYHESRLANSFSIVHPRLNPVYSMYREAKNSWSPFYKFFCLYKILEGLFHLLIPAMQKEAKARSITLPLMTAKVPSWADDGEVIPDEQLPYIGRSINRFFEQFLQVQFRNAVAHFMSDEGAVLDINEVDAVDRYHGVIKVTELCCRSVIQHAESCVRLLHAESV